jgi:transcriptional regulator with XRE-family HTH domain
LKYLSAMERNAQLELLGKHIRAIRMGQELSQDQVAFKAGFSRSYFGGVERGVRNISAVNLIQLAKALGVEVGDLFPRLEKLR